MDSFTATVTEGVVSSAGIMTPSSSGRTVKFLEPMRPTPIPFPYLSPTPSPVHYPIPNETLDILGDLYCFGPLEMAKKVLSYLEPANLFNCLLVSKTWYTMISQDIHLMRKMDTYKKNRRKRSYSQMTSGHTSIKMFPRPPPRQVLADISISSFQLFAEAKPSAATLDTLALPCVKHCHCPNCKSPAIELHLRRAECKRCKYDFCRHCFRQYHEGFCRTKQELWGGEEDCDSGPSKIHVAGIKSKAVKRRLKRL